MRFLISLCAIMLTASLLQAQTYTPINGKIVITVNQSTQDGGEIITRTGELDSLEAANRFFGSLIATNQRIAELRVEVDELERQSARANKAFQDLSGQNTDIKIADLYGQSLIGLYTITDTTSVKDCEIKLNAQGKLVLNIPGTNYAIKVLSTQLFTVSKLITNAPAVEFIIRKEGLYVYSERGRVIKLQKKN